ncbi:hypothetical protein I3F58_28125 [Streptomyces sp. MUM 203J]|uniref:hypothetical protein n=1 Tax=Streptomyces sp. MUM 203J TaxID=2791990 RepID=UPI001F0353B9|nr:hypothetical protein [Streptomyces sp. MUM 203J]MCH0543347.1 hypothetical protein [Streptomyces sp. MUM 203J]
MVRRGSGRALAGIAALCAAVGGIGAAVPTALSTVRVDSAAAGPEGRTATVSYTYRCAPEERAVSLAVRVVDRTTGAASPLTRLREPQGCDGDSHTRATEVTASGAEEGFHAGDGVVVRVLMNGTGNSVMSVAASRAMVLR